MRGVDPFWVFRLYAIRGMWWAGLSTDRFKVAKLGLRAPLPSRRVVEWSASEAYRTGRPRGSTVALHLAVILTCAGALHSASVNEGMLRDMREGLGRMKGIGGLSGEFSALSMIDYGCCKSKLSFLTVIYGVFNDRDVFDDFLMVN